MKKNLTIIILAILCGCSRSPDKKPLGLSTESNTAIIGGVTVTVFHFQGYTFALAQNQGMGTVSLIEINHSPQR